MDICKQNISWLTLLEAEKQAEMYKTKLKNAEIFAELILVSFARLLIY
jgi:hypothetical protein